MTKDDANIITVNARTSLLEILKKLCDKDLVAVQRTDPLCNEKELIEAGKFLNSAIEALYKAYRRT